MKEWNNENGYDDKELNDTTEPKDVEQFESSFTHHAVPLDQLETLDENGNIFSIKELMDLKDLKEELE